MAKEKTGIEINDYADVIISTSVLEHVENPFEILRELKDKLKDGGKAFDKNSCIIVAYK